MSRKTPVAIIGGGGHSEVVWEMLRLSGYEVIGYTSPESQANRPFLPWIGPDEQLFERYSNEELQIANGIGMIRSGGLRDKLYKVYKEQGYRFVMLAHPSAIISPDAVLEEGTQIMAGAIVQTGATVGSNSILNTRSSIDHHCRIGSSVHIAPGAIICGEVKIGDASMIGAGAIVIQGVAIGQAATIGAGAVVLRDVAAYATVTGIPAKESTT
ncbi:acetyltransferase [Paenibacillus albus]|uniref:Acetyltransferase n=1 Tax=Paenibacillus albus TaxID=2495582 RepID=A0A3S8ZYE1_9BACL|nr:acetyltransferase [Paenibacillus albus]AZN38513.1 acetyltransferase [Paenibacillus albus]